MHRASRVAAYILLLLPFASRTIAAAESKPSSEGPAAKAVAKVPEGVDPAMTSGDAEYGYSKEKPIKVGSADKFGGPAAERAYLSGLRDEAGKRVGFKRRGSVGRGPEGNILDCYEVTTSSGKKVALYIDMYHPKRDPHKQLAPKGLYKAKR